MSASGSLESTCGYGCTANELHKTNAASEDRSASRIASGPEKDSATSVVSGVRRNDAASRAASAS